MEKAVRFRTIMNEPYRDHPSEDALERFLLNQSDEEELEIVETHFFACEPCVDRLEALELTIAAKKLALRNYQEKQLKLAQTGRPKRSWFGLPQLSFAGAALTVFVIAGSLASVPRDVTLLAERGTEIQSAPEWVPINLHLQAREIKTGPVTVKLVNGLAQEIWESEASVKNEQIDVRIPRFKASGEYLVRVYSPTASDPVGNLIREYLISVQPRF